ncbi:saccharopine dehydrogenase NADP-binding domain-containing protein [Flavobacterium sp. HBTb2-11-1]|uniref:saccharopine dehydrogenase NADP-binding domain-containing protein n=1 Tax=Flavobacterium sp. HBTb2-11-1 TaxID=2692212 RepID=UPI00136A3B22|nr:saccharopine dehydrogenase NADP-binding domain-containing protein [Flavobacterium sp. HBTb2-11-1]MXO07265.1 NAD-dependent epimerase/dehydratase family protein [Flavobacterium sp. HBTb2-11-1]
MRKNILVIGGTGLVGKVILRILEARNPDFNLFIGSRQSGKNANNLVIDVTNSKTFDAITDNKIDLIVLCTKDSNNEILQFAIKNKVDYIDITKPTPELTIAYDLARTMLNVQSRIVFSSGWMGGIVPSLIDFAESDKTKIQETGIYIYYSVKDLAGKSSANFLAENVCKPFLTYKNDKPLKVKHFLDSERFNFSFGIGDRQVYNLDVPDLFVLNQIEKIPTVSVKMTYNSKFITRLMGYFQSLKIFNIMLLRERQLLFGSSGNGDQTAFEVIIKTQNTTRRISLQSLKGQAELTAFSTVLHIEKMLSESLSGGVYFSHQIHSSKEVYEALNSYSTFNLKMDK